MPVQPFTRAGPTLFLEKYPSFSHIATIIRERPQASEADVSPINLSIPGSPRLPGMALISIKKPLWAGCPQRFT